MIVVVMGVAGAGKTVVGQRLAAALDAEFIDADDHHSPENVAKMRAGTPLTDEDRWPWLARLNGMLREREAGGRSAVLACSALKAAYREALLQQLPAAREKPIMTAAEPIIMPSEKPIMTAAEPIITKQEPVVQYVSPAISTSQPPVQGPPAYGGKVPAGPDMMSEVPPVHASATAA